MINFEKLSWRKKLFEKATGVKLEHFQKIVEKVRPDWEARQAKKKCNGRNSNIENLENEILLVMMYYRYYTSQFFLGMQFGLDAANVCRHIKWMEPLIIKAVRLKKDRTLSEKDLQMIMDATEIRTQRPRHHQKRYYSGKKKNHTIKAEAIIDIRGKILSISQAVPGRMHDFKLRKQSDKIPQNATILADSGYQGLQKLHQNTVLPIKRKRTKCSNLKKKSDLKEKPEKTKKSSLTSEERKHNRELSSKRVKIEHVFAHLKKFKILGSVYRNFQKKLGLRLNIIAGIYNLRFA